MEGPTSSGGSKNRLTCLNLNEHDDDDNDIYILYKIKGTAFPLQAYGAQSVLGG
jgi:hypothetical protein